MGSIKRAKTGEWPAFTSLETFSSARFSSLVSIQRRSARWVVFSQDQIQESKKVSKIKDGLCGRWALRTLYYNIVIKISSQHRYMYVYY